MAKKYVGPSIQVVEMPEYDAVLASGVGTDFDFTEDWFSVSEGGVLQ